MYLLKWHGEGQLPYAGLARRQPHANSVTRRCEEWLEQNYRAPRAVTGVVKMSGVPERSLKRRFKMATGTTLINDLQNLRIEEAKRLLETEQTSFEEICASIRYENLAFFRRLCKRGTGLTPGQYRRMFRPFAEAAGVSTSAPGASSE